MDIFNNTTKKSIPKSSIHKGSSTAPAETVELIEKDLDSENDIGVSSATAETTRFNLLFLFLADWDWATFALNVCPSFLWFR